MIRILWRLAKGYRLRPWKSPYLRWRIETYWGVQAGSISKGDFWRFLWRHRAELVRFLRWAQRMERQARSA